MAVHLDLGTGKVEGIVACSREPKGLREEGVESMNWEAGKRIGQERVEQRGDQKDRRWHRAAGMEGCRGVGAGVGVGVGVEGKHR